MPGLIGSMVAQALQAHDPQHDTDPPALPTQVRLLNRTLPIRLDPALTPSQKRELTELIVASANVLNQNHSDGLLTNTDIDYLNSLNGLGAHIGRSGTPLNNRRGPDYGVFSIGTDDAYGQPATAEVKARLFRPAVPARAATPGNLDPAYWASADLHDGGHAYLRASGQPATRDADIAAEAPLTQVQIDYFRRLNQPYYVGELEKFRDNPEAQRARNGQTYQRGR